MLKVRKVFILLFPQEEYFGSYINEIDMFKKCIKERYIDDNYEFIIINYKDSINNIINLICDKCIQSAITFEQSKKQYADFEYIVRKLDVEAFDKIVVGGFHCFDCVEKLANEIYKINKSVLIDSDLTEMFWSTFQSQENFRFDKFNKDEKLLKMLNKDKVIPLGILEKMKERYSNPIWGISNELLEVIDKRIKETKEEYKNMKLNKKR